ncbi:SDR family NAD(P)-dependent oxidoreductase [Streptomyces sp. NBC_00094]|nr:SDR family NAD(P)-dependent oxidoreductase [Streptomyces sp. NBC_00094]
MKDAFGTPQSLLVLGGTSEIGLATARRLIVRGVRTVWLAGRPSPALAAAADSLRALGADVRAVPFDALDTESHEERLGKIFAEGAVDIVLLAFGILGDQAHDESDPVAAVRVAQTNYTGAVSAGLVCAGALQTQGHGSLVVLSSVAGERARRADFLYGSSKAGLDVFAQGLGDALYGTGVHVMVVRPGSVRARGAGGRGAVTGRREETAAGRVAAMAGHGAAVPGYGATVPGYGAAAVWRGEAAGGRGKAVARRAEVAAGRAEMAARRAGARLATTPEAVATAIELGLRRGSETVWVPGTLRMVMAAVRHVPRPLFRLLPI